VGYALGLALTLLLNTIVFALLFKFLPDTTVRWGDVWVGAIVTAVIWEIGKRLLTLYAGTLSYASAYGAVGTVLVLMVWIYFSSQILFLGAEFTEVYSRRRGSRMAQPEPPPAAQPAPAAQPTPAAPAASSSGRVVAAGGVGLLVGVIGGGVAAMAALAIGLLKVVAPLTRRLRRDS